MGQSYADQGVTFSEFIECFEPGVKFESRGDKFRVDSVKRCAFYSAVVCTHLEHKYTTGESVLSLMKDPTFEFVHEDIQITLNPPTEVTP